MWNSVSRIKAAQELGGFRDQSAKKEILA
jgi:hypothetical protein